MKLIHRLYRVLVNNSRSNSRKCHPTRKMLAVGHKFQTKRLFRWESREGQNEFSQTTDDPESQRQPRQEKLLKRKRLNLGKLWWRNLKKHDKKGNAFSKSKYYKGVSNHWTSLMNPENYGNIHLTLCEDFCKRQ